MEQWCPGTTSGKEGPTSRCTNSNPANTGTNDHPSLLNTWASTARVLGPIWTLQTKTGWNMVENGLVEATRMVEGWGSY